MAKKKRPLEPCLVCGEAPCVCRRNTVKLMDDVASRTREDKPDLVAALDELRDMEDA